MLACVSARLVCLGVCVCISVRECVIECVWYVSVRGSVLAC